MADLFDKKLLRKEINAEMAALRKEIKYQKGMMEKHSEKRRIFDDLDRAHSMPWSAISAIQDKDERERMDALKAQANKMGHIHNTKLSKDAATHRNAELAVKMAEKSLGNLSRASVE